MAQPVLRLENICKVYHDMAALKNVNLALLPGQVCALLGGNGAGKSTLTKIITGETKMKSGQIYIDGAPVEIASPYEAKKLGIISCPQDIAVFDQLSITENLFLGSELKKNALVLDWPRMNKLTEEMLARFGIAARPAEKTKRLSLAEKYLIQFARVLLSDYKVIVMDELTDSLTMAEVSVVYDIMAALKANGACIIYITHRIDEAMRTADMIGIMKDGEMAAFMPAKQAKKDTIAKKMLGDDIKTHYPKLPVARQETVMRVKNISNRFLSNISFSLRRGEVLGIAGLVGSGRTSLMKAIVGLAKLDCGSIELLHGKDDWQRFEHWHDAIGYMPENRDTQGLFEDFSVVQNITIKRLDGVSNMHWIKPHKEAEVGEDIVYRLGIKANSVHQKVLYLSGGNKQKTLVGRSVFSKCSVYVFDEPTKGVDIAGKVEIFNIMNELVRKGAAIIMVSSDFSELAGMSDRVLVIKKGSIVAELNRNEMTQQTLFSLCKE